MIFTIRYEDFRSKRALDQGTLYFKENENYQEGNGEVWIYRYFEGNKVGAIYCLTTDKKYLISYYDPEFEKNKKKGRK
jgi:hypothetical protein